jgi:hypothetical protein
MYTLFLPDCRLKPEGGVDGKEGLRRGHIFSRLIAVLKAQAVLLHVAQTPIVAQC